MMTKKDYERIARVFRMQYETKADPKRVQMIDVLIAGLAYEFAIDNPKFDKARFVAACGKPSRVEQVTTAILR